jgi:hypothetical protein
MHACVLQAELRDIVNKRRDFEYLLQRRAPRKVDYIRYVAYEIEIEELRRERKAALGECPQTAPVCGQPYSTLLLCLGRHPQDVSQRSWL